MTTLDRGTTLLFFPAGLLVVVILASITVDFARVHLARRAAEDAAAAAANDAVTVALDQDRLRSDGTYRLDPARVEAVVAENVARQRLHGLDRIRIISRATGARSVEVLIHADVGLGFAGVLPGAPEVIRIVARAAATAELR